MSDTLIVLEAVDDRRKVREAAGVTVDRKLELDDGDGEGLLGVSVPLREDDLEAVLVCNRLCDGLAVGALLDVGVKEWLPASVTELRRDVAVSGTVPVKSRVRDFVGDWSFVSDQEAVMVGEVLAVRVSVRLGESVTEEESKVPVCVRVRERVKVGDGDKLDKPTVRDGVLENVPLTINVAVWTPAAGAGVSN